MGSASGNHASARVLHRRRSTISAVQTAEPVGSMSGELMSRHLIACLVIAVLLSPSVPVVAAHGSPVTAVYDTVDAVESSSDYIVIAGIISGSSTPTEVRYDLFEPAGVHGVAAARCDRLALLAIAKPGKYQFAIVALASFGARFGCKLIVRAP